MLVQAAGGLRAGLGEMPKAQSLPGDAKNCCVLQGWGGMGWEKAWEKVGEEEEWEEEEQEEEDKEK